MSGAFTADMGAEAMAAQLNAMRDELIARFQANEDEHDRLRTATEAVKSVFIHHAKASFLVTATPVCTCSAAP